MGSVPDEIPRRDTDATPQESKRPYPKSNDWTGWDATLEGQFRLSGLRLLGSCGSGGGRLGVLRGIPALLSVSDPQSILVGH